MTIEKSHGKARPTLPRSSDLATVGTARERTVNHGSDGRFTAGNSAANGRGCRRVQKGLLGPEGGTDDERMLRRDAWRVFTATLATLPSDAPPVRTLASLHSRHAVLAAYYGRRAAEAGLDSVDGMKLQEAADRQSQRAERVLVTALDVATKIAAKDEEQVDHLAMYRARAGALPARGDQ